MKFDQKEIDNATYVEGRGGRKVLQLATPITPRENLRLAFKKEELWEDILEQPYQFLSLCFWIATYGKSFLDLFYMTMADFGKICHYVHSTSLSQSNAL